MSEANWSRVLQLSLILDLGLKLRVNKTHWSGTFHKSNINVTLAGNLKSRLQDCTPFPTEVERRAEAENLRVRIGEQNSFIDLQAQS